MKILLLGFLTFGLSLTKPHYQHPYTYPIVHTIKQHSTTPAQSTQTIITNAPTDPTPLPQVLGTSDVNSTPSPAPTNTPENLHDSRVNPSSNNQPTQTNSPQPTLNPTPSPQDTNNDPPDTPTPTATTQPTNSPKPTTSTSPPPTQIPKNSGSINQAVNQYRNQHNLSELNPHSQLCQIAKQRVQEITTDFSHSGFDPAVKESGIDYQSISENIWWGSNLNLENTTKDWHNSASHREALQGDWTHGCGAIHQNHVAYLFLNQ